MRDRAGFGRCAACACARAVSWHQSVERDHWLGPFDSRAGLGAGGYELAGGEYVDFAPWYDATSPDVTVLLLRRMSQELGLIWGISTGERAQKHRIQPGLHLGVAWRRPISAIGAVSVTAVVPFFGRLRERACIADYGAIGGVQRVNCRLAASELPPEETLRYLLDIKGIDDARLTLRLSWQF